MAVTPIFPVLLIAVITRCKCDHTSGYSTSNGNSASQFGALLKPPPLSQILPVPFYGGATRTQQKNVDVGYIYQVPPPPPPSPIPPPTAFKFPAPFYKQYNFNFVPPPQPFSTTPSPSLFQKVSTWLFPSQQTSNDVGSSALSNNNIAAIKKDCNPCNIVPWIPVIRYNSLGSKNVYQNAMPTYGPPSPTAYTNLQNVGQYRPQPVNTQNEKQTLPQLTPGAPYAHYGPPGQSHTFNSVEVVSSTYGPPSPSNTIIDISSKPPPSSIYSVLSSSYKIPTSTYSLPSTSVAQPSSSYVPNTSQGVFPSHNVASATYRPSTLSYVTSSPSYLIPLPAYGTPQPTTPTLESITPPYEPGILNNELPQQSEVEILRDIETSEELQLPKVTHPTGFKNSYGEAISDTKIFDIPFPVPDTAVESTKIKTEVLPHDNNKLSVPNISVALANPAPFSRGRNIHTLQPVALPNLSVSPLPPIFNARPFRPVTPVFLTNVVQGINQMQQIANNVNIAQSVPLIEFTHSVEYPATFIQSPIIDIDASKASNQTKAYRNIPNSFVIDEMKDISSQASEDHISATKSVSESSFESTGVDFGNNIYDTSIPQDLKPSSYVPSNHKANFADLRGVKDEEVDKYRIESNLQNIDSPLLYLKPSAPHKNHQNFVLAVSTPLNDSDYEIYDETPTIVPPQTPAVSGWDESRIDYSDQVPPTVVREDTYQPKIVQIIVPYTTDIKEKESDRNVVQATRGWSATSEKDYQARKFPSNTETTQRNTHPENYSTLPTTTDEPKTTVTESYDSEQLNPAALPNDFDDVREPPFDIIQLQHTIDDWTEQEYSKEYKTPQRIRSSEKYAKQIPDEYLTTTIPTSYVTDTSNFNYEFYDHESASSIQHSVTDDGNNTFIAPLKEYNAIGRTKNRDNSGKNGGINEVQKLYNIYTAASSFRTSSPTTTTTTSSTTPAPWGKIQTSISPLTKEKVYVVTSKPWREPRNVSHYWNAVEQFESKKTNVETDETASDNLPFKSPRFMNRPSFGFTSGGKVESVKSDSSYVFSKSWYQSINDLENQPQNNSTSLPESPQTPEKYH